MVDRKNSRLVPGIFIAVAVVCFLLLAKNLVQAWRTCLEGVDVVSFQTLPLYNHKFQFRKRRKNPVLVIIFPDKKGADFTKNLQPCFKKKCKRHKGFGNCFLYSLHVLLLLIKKGVGNWPDETLATCLQQFLTRSA